MSKVVKLEKLSGSERTELGRCLKVLRALPDQLHDAALAYQTIREDRLYRETHGTFEAFCREVLGVTASRVRQITAAHEVSTSIRHSLIKGDADRLKSVTRVTLLPENEYQIRPLISVPDEQRTEVWQKAVQLAGGRQPSASVVARAVSENANPGSHFENANARSHFETTDLSIVRRALGLLKTVSQPTKNITAAIDLLCRDVESGGGTTAKGIIQ